MKMNYGLEVSFVSLNHIVIMLTVFSFGPVPSTGLSIPEIPFDIEAESYFIIYAQEGKNLSLLCPDIFASSHVRLFIDINYEIELDERITFDPESGFRIIGLSIKDSGIYRCTSEYEHIVRTFRWFNVIVTKTPTPDVVQIDESKLRHVIKGQVLKVNCSAQIPYSPTTVIKWRSPSGHEIGTRQYLLDNNGLNIISGELIISNISSQHAGVYTCCLQTLTSDCSNKMTAMVVVQKPPKYQNEADIVIERISVENGTTVTLSCPKTIDQDEIRSFTDDDYADQLSNRTSYNATLGFQIKNFIGTDSGIYKCKVAEGNGYVTVKIFDVQLIRKPRELGHPEIDVSRLYRVVEGQTLRVNCTIEYESPDYVTIFWSLPGQSEMQGRTDITPYLEEIADRNIVSLELRIQNISMNDAGIYRCHRFTMGPPITATATLTVNAKSQTVK